MFRSIIISEFEFCILVKDGKIYCTPFPDLITDTELRENLNQIANMLLRLCKSCQYCLESMYWNCCEEKYCFDKKIATYGLDEDTTYSNGYTNMGASLDSVVTVQPPNNNHLPPNAIVGREINDIPLHADKLYEIFSKSMIFREDFELKSKGSMDSLDEIETKSEPDYLSEKPNRTKVYFEDEVNSPVTDFEIMFKDELFKHNMFKIDEEEDKNDDSDKRSPDEGLVMSVSIKKQNVIKPTTVTIKDEDKITTQHPVYEYDPNNTLVGIPSSLSLPRVESLKGILRQKTDLPRSLSVRNLERDCGMKINKPLLNRVESLKNMSPEKINKVLARVPYRSASFLNIPQHLVPDKPPLTKSKSTIGVSFLAEENKISQLPDTPIIRSNNLPRFFAESPTLPEYKEEMSLSSLQKQSEMMFKDNDFSMPRYYGTVKSIDDVAQQMNESKSMPDLRNAGSTGKVSKRLVKLRSRLKPLVIKKGTDERL